MPSSTGRAVSADQAEILPGSSASRGCALELLGSRRMRKSSARSRMSAAAGQRAKTLLSAAVPKAQSVEYSCSAGVGQNLSGTPLNCCPAALASVRIANLWTAR